MPDETRKDSDYNVGKSQELGEPASDGNAKSVMDAPVTFSLRGLDGQMISAGEGLAQLYEDNLTVLPKFGEVLSFTYRSFLEYGASDYRIEILFTTKERLSLSDLGLQYEDFERNMVNLRNQLILSDMLMNEKMFQPTARGSLTMMGSDSRPLLSGEGELRIYETALVVLPDAGDPLRIPYSDIKSFNAQDYMLEITTEYGEKFSASQLGQRLDPFTKALSDASLALQQKVVSMLTKLLPLSSPVDIRRVARYMKEGRAARRSDITAVSPSIWDDLEKRLKTVNMDLEYSFLKDMSQQGRICIGIKEGLLDQPDAQYLWFLIPIYSLDPSKPGNAIAMEASSTGETGRATYFFRMATRSDYRNFKDMHALDEICDTAISTINRAMIEINFRREPIYLKEEQFMEPKYQKYLFAVQRLNALRCLRELYIGRVFHQTPEQWRADVDDLLKFNASVSDDNARWQGRQPEVENASARENDN